MTEHDPTEYFRGSSSGIAGRAAVGGRLSERNGFRFELDVPRWHILDTTSTHPIWCAPESTCLTKGTWIPARSSDHFAVRTVSYSFLYSLHLPPIDRVHIAVVAGGSMEQRDSRSAGSWDELSDRGDVLQHHEYTDDRTRYWPAIVAGVDAEVRVTSHVAVTPQFRFHTFPYPQVSIIRPGVALRWNF
jgi:hypothetical protein